MSVNYAIVPAAGRSSRLGRSKAMLPLGGQPMIDILLQCLRDGGVEAAIVVVAAGDDRLIDHCRDRPGSVAVNRRPQVGMLRSIELGHRALSRDLEPQDTVLVCPVDYPWVQPETVKRLLRVRNRSRADAVVPVLEGRRGHPLALAASACESIRTLSDDLGLRQLLNQVEVLEVEVGDPGVRRDLDTWEDYFHLAAKVSAEGRRCPADS